MAPFEHRYLDHALDELALHKFVLLAGPRQVGKTTMAKRWLQPRGGVYLNWDTPPDRRAILRNAPFDAVGAMVLDELHKYARWKSYLKGLYDKAHERLSVVVTGSARLDVYTRGGDSMLGRYELLRLHPLSLAELVRGHTIPPPPTDAEGWIGLGGPAAPESVLEQLERFGGFPEPFFRSSAAFHTRWSSRRRDLVLREDLRELTQIRTLSVVEHMWLLLPERVGSLLSINALREELAVAHDTASAWLDAFERLYLVFRLAPYVVRRTRSLTKERKLYLWDWSQVEDEAARFENLVASHLQKAVHAWCDLGLGQFDLFYFRDREKREVDFVVTSRRRPVALVECKLTDDAIAPSLVRIGELLPDAAKIQVVRKPGVDRRHGRTRVVSAGVFLAGLC